MKIGIIIPSPILSPTGGVKIQAEMWRDGFNMLGHEGVLVNAWENQDWESYDAIIIMGFGGSFRLWTKYLSWRTKKLAVAPIIDTTVNILKKISSLITFSIFCQLLFLISSCSTFLPKKMLP